MGHAYTCQPRCPLGWPGLSEEQSAGYDLLQSSFRVMVGCGLSLSRGAERTISGGSSQAGHRRPGICLIPTLKHTRLGEGPIDIVRALLNPTQKGDYIRANLAPTTTNTCSWLMV